MRSASRYAPTTNRWGSELSLRSTRGQSQETAGTGFFAPKAYAVLDLTGWAVLSHGIKVRAGVLNLTDAKYFEWPNVRGRSATDTTIDRYSSPGISGLLSLSYGW
ncbi:MAG: TonB-dependent receptor [Vicinamibacterales bacterium]